MTIIKTDDERYPIKFDDSWGDGAYLYYDIIMNDDKWSEFIKELEKIREEIKKNA